MESMCNTAINKQLYQTADPQPLVWNPREPLDPTHCKHSADFFLLVQFKPEP